MYFLPGAVAEGERASWVPYTGFSFLLYIVFADIPTDDTSHMPCRKSDVGRRASYKVLHRARAAMWGPMVPPRPHFLNQKWKLWELSLGGRGRAWSPATPDPTAVLLPTRFCGPCL